MPSLCFPSSLSFKRAAWIHDVFLSFSGEDARHKLCRWLYNALVTNDIKAYRDDVNLERGKYIEKELLNAIEESRFSIVIFSKNYASSKFCLEELVKIVRCRKKKGHTAFPIFYHAKAADVQNQTGDYKQAFEEHEKKYSNKMVQRWRDALREVAGIAGWSAKNHSEPELVRLVVKQILDKLNPTCPGTSMLLVPLNSMYLYQEWDDVQIVWICGMAGMGNTTFPRAVYDAVTTNVSEKCGLGPVKEVSSEFSVEWSSRIWDPSSEITAIKKKMQHKKVLLIVDDMDKQEHLVNLARKDDLFGPGSRIIVSTTDPDKNNQQINVIGISFDGQMGRERKIYLDVVSFLATPLSLKEMNFHATRIFESLVSDGLPTKLAFKFLTQSFKVIRDDFLENPPSRSGIVLVEIGGNNVDQSEEDESTHEGNKEATEIEKGKIKEKKYFKQTGDSTQTASTSIIPESNGRAKQFGSNSSDEKPGPKQVYNTEGATSKRYIERDETIPIGNGTSDAKPCLQRVEGTDGSAGNAIMAKPVDFNEEVEAEGNDNLAEKPHSERIKPISFSICDRLL